MTPIRTALAGVLIVAAVSSCAGSPAGGGATSSPAAPPTAVAAPAPEAAAGSDAQAAVADVFRRYYRALLDRDFATACELNAAETKAAMLDNLRRQGGITAATCEDAFEKIYAVPGAAQVADRISTTARVGAVTVTGDRAAVNWTAEVQGRSQEVTNQMRLVDGQWRLLDTNT
jgi:hypothetical protein